MLRVRFTIKRDWVFFTWKLIRKVYIEDVNWHSPRSS
jgi:hypothetical protein